MKGPDRTLPGYTADLSDLGNNQVVAITLVQHKDKMKARPKQPTAPGGKMPARTPTPSCSWTTTSRRSRWCSSSAPRPGTDMVLASGPIGGLFVFLAGGCRKQPLTRAARLIVSTSTTSPAAAPSPLSVAVAPSIIMRSSLLMAMNCHPSAMRIFASSTLMWMPAGTLLPAGGGSRAPSAIASPLGGRPSGLRMLAARSFRPTKMALDAGDGEDLVCVVDSLDVLALEDDEEGVVGVGVVVRGGGAEVEAVDAAADAAGSNT